jgi:sugar phosphate isomerase/epimerase
MIKTMHGLSTMHCNLVTEIRLARETGYDALEIVESKLLRYLDQGFGADELVPHFARHAVRPVCINALKSIERMDPQERGQLMLEAERLCIAARAIDCPTIQIVAFSGLEGRPEDEILRLVASNIAEIADIGRMHGIRFQLEPIAWSPICSLKQSLDLIKMSGRDNVGVVIDFWHLWAGEATEPDEVAKLDPSVIYGVHFCDGKRIPKGQRWTEASLRGYLPGEGDIPIRDWVTAVKATGYDGSWSCELLSPRHWEWDLREIAVRCRELMEYYVA